MTDKTEFHMSDNIFIKQIVIGKAGWRGPQHSHNYDHTSMLAVGSVRLWKDGVLLGDFKAPTGILIPAGTKHLFMALEDNTVIYCIHNTHNFPSDELEQHLVKERHELP